MSELLQKYRGNDGETFKILSALINNFLSNQYCNYFWFEDLLPYKTLVFSQKFRQIDVLLKNLTINWIDGKNLHGSEFMANSCGMKITEIYSVSLSFDKNFVKATFLLKKLLKLEERVDFTKYFLVRENFHTTTVENELFTFSKLSWYINEWKFWRLSSY